MLKTKNKHLKILDLKIPIHKKQRLKEPLKRAFPCIMPRAEPQICRLVVKADLDRAATSVGITGRTMFPVLLAWVLQVSA